MSLKGKGDTYDPKYNFKQSKTEGNDMPTVYTVRGKYEILTALRAFNEVGLVQFGPTRGSADRLIAMFQRRAGDYVIHQYDWDGAAWSHCEQGRYESQAACLSHLEELPQE